MRLTRLVSALVIASTALSVGVAIGAPDVLPYTLPPLGLLALAAVRLAHRHT